MNRSQLISEVATRTGKSKKAVAEVVETALAVMGETLSEGTDVSLAGFGNFRLKARAARNQRIPTTGETRVLPAHKVLVFKPTTELKKAVA